MKPRRLPVGLAAVAATPRTALPVTVLAEDFSLLVRLPRRMRLARGTRPTSCPTVLN